MEYKELMIADVNAIGRSEQEFLDLHREILYCGNMSATYAVSMAKNLKKMRDGKLYRAADFETFGAYVENAVGIKERQAYNYISVLESLPSDFLQLNAKLGITKLSLLAPLTETEREEIISSTDVENATVKQLKDEIAARQNKIDQLRFEFAEMEKKVKGVNDALARKDGEYAEEIKNLKADKEAYKDTAKRLSVIEKEKKQLEDEINILKANPTEVQTVDNPETESKLVQATEAKVKLEQEVERLHKQLLLATDTSIIKFKVKFEDFQKIGMEMIELLQIMDKDKADKCRMAIKSVMAGWNL